MTPGGIRAASWPRREPSGSLREVDALRARGLVAGGRARIALVLDGDGLVGGHASWPDEFVRHKAGDILGDLASIGAGSRPTSSPQAEPQGTIALARGLTTHGGSRGGAVMESAEIMDVIPHRYPFLLVDRILEVEQGKRIVGIKNVTINEPFFQGHFPGHPIMPGVLIIEAMAQVGGMLLLGTIEDPETKGRVLHVARQREVPPARAAGRPAPLRARDAAESRANLPDEGRGLRRRPGRGGSGDDGAGGGSVIRHSSDRVIDPSAELGYRASTVGPLPSSVPR